jgi:hypothetical protein
MVITIEKAKLIKSGEKVYIDFTKEADNGTRSSGGETFEAIPHPDLKKAFDALIIHFAVMTGQVPVKSVKDITNYKDELIEGFRVSSYSIGGEREGITITGTRLLWNGKAFNTNTPYYLFEESEQTRYTFMDDLVEKLGRVDEELRKYMAGEKRGTDGQLTMFDNAEKPVTKLQIAEPEKPVFNDTQGLHDVTEEYIEMNNQRKTNLKIPQADPEAMKRVAAADHEDAEVIEETTNVPKKKKETTRKKKVAQSADAPGGEVEEPAD